MCVVAPQQPETTEYTLSDELCSLHCAISLFTRMWLACWCEQCSFFYVLGSFIAFALQTCSVPNEMIFFFVVD